MKILVIKNSSLNRIPRYDGTRILRMMLEDRILVLRNAVSFSFFDTSDLKFQSRVCRHTRIRVHAGLFTLVARFTQSLRSDSVSVFVFTFVAIRGMYEYKEIFLLSCPFRPLFTLGVNVLLNFQLQKVLNVDERVIQNWLIEVERHYYARNPYHNSTHAADVLQAIAYFLKKDKVRRLLDDIDNATCLIAAITHDIGHPGRSRYVSVVFFLCFCFFRFFRFYAR